MSRYEAACALHKSVTIFSVQKAPALYGKEVTLFGPYGDDGMPTPAAVTNGYTGTTATGCGVDKNAAEAQAKYPAEYAVFSCGVLKPMLILVGASAVFSRDVFCWGNAL